MKFHDFVEAVFKAMDEHPEWRQGQTLFNTYAKFFPAEELRLSEHNPFYDDSKVADAWDYIGRNWKD
jgi:hypothetical protein